MLLIVGFLFWQCTPSPVKPEACALGREIHGQQKPLLSDTMIVKDHLLMRKRNLNHYHGTKVTS